MPYRDPQAKSAWGVAYRKRKMAEGYGRWLYARRKARYNDAEEFRSVLRFIAEGKFSEASTIARIALEESAKRHAAIGEFPESDYSDRSQNGNRSAPKADTLAEALLKLGLTPRPS